MGIIVSPRVMVRIAVFCFVLGVALGVYLGVGGGQEVAPHVQDPTSGTAPLAAGN